MNSNIRLTKQPKSKQLDSTDNETVDLNENLMEIRDCEQNLESTVANQLNESNFLNGQNTNSQPNNDLNANTNGMKKSLAARNNNENSNSNLNINVKNNFNISVILN